MKKTVHYLLVFTGLLLGSRVAAQELVYEQDHGLSFNKGTINTDVLIQIIQEKQEELNKFVLQRMITQTWLKSSGSDDSKLDNFTTKYLIYKTMNELTVTADKSKFGKNTLELLKEASIVFGIAYSTKRDFLIRPVVNESGESSKVDGEQVKDKEDISEQLDMVLNACLENPKMVGYFPLYSRLLNPEDPDRHWYLNDNRYLQEQDSLVQAYQNVVKEVDRIATILSDIQKLQQNFERVKGGALDSVVGISERLLLDLKNLKPIDSNTVIRLKDSLQVVVNIVPESFVDLAPKLKEAKKKVDDLLENVADSTKLQQLNDLIVLINDLKSDIERVREGDFTPLLDALESEIRKYVVNGITIGKHSIKGFDVRLQELETAVQSIDIAFKNDPFLIQLDSMLAVIGKGSWKDLTTEVSKLSYEFENWKLEEDNRITYTRAKQLLKKLRKCDGVSFLSSKYVRLKRKIKQNKDEFGYINRKEVKTLLDKEKGVSSDNSNKTKNWDNAVDATGLMNEFGEKSIETKGWIRLNTIIDTLKALDERYQIVRQMFTVLAQSKGTQGLKGFFFNEQQLAASKDLINSLIDHLDKSGGRFNVVAVYLKSLVNNVNYREADTIDHKPATISLNFESVLFSLNDQLVTPSRLYRTRYVQPFIHIGVNYAYFAKENQLKINEDGTTGNLNSLSYASEKIGVKFKIANQKYTRSFAPGVNYRYYNYPGTSRVWNRPQPKTAIDDYFVDVYAGGLLYNAVNLKSEKNFDFPFAGIGFGVRTFNGLTFTGSYNAPFTNGLAENRGWIDNGFWMFSIDIPIIEYISALRKNK